LRIIEETPEQEMLAMPPATDTIDRVADRDKKKGRGRPPTGRTPTVTVFARVPPPLAQALDAYLDSLRPQPTTTAVVVAALEDFLQARGFWSPPPPDAD
jgi:hypothetical protein